MGYIEIHDGITTRRVQVPELSGTVRLEADGDAPTVVVPDDTEVRREQRTPQSGVRQELY